MTMPGATKRSGKRKFSKDDHSAEAEQKRQCMPLTDSKRSVGSQASALGHPGQVDDNTTCNADTVVATLTNADYGSCSKGTAKDDVEQPNTAANTDAETERRAYIEPTSKGEKSEEIPASTENNGDFGDANIHEETEENDRHSTMHLRVSEQMPGERTTAEHVQRDQTGDGKHNSNNFGAGPRSDMDSVAERSPLHQQDEKDNPAEDSKAEVTNQTRDCDEIVESSPGREGEDVRIVENREALNTNDEVDLKVAESSKSSTPSANTEGATVQANTAPREAKDKESSEEFRGNEFTRPPVDPVFGPKKVDTHGLNAASRDQPMSQDKSERLDTQHGNSNQTAVERSFQAEPGPEQKSRSAGNPVTIGFTRSNVETTQQEGDNIKEDTKAKTGVDGVRCSELLPLLKGGKPNGCPAGGTEEDTSFADGNVFEMDVTESQLCAVPDDILSEQEEVAMDRAAETRRQQEEDREKKAVQEILGSLLKMNDLVIKTRREMETIKRRYQGLSGGIGHEKPK